MGHTTPDAEIDESYVDAVNKGKRLPILNASMLSANVTPNEFCLPAARAKSMSNVPLARGGAVTKMSSSYNAANVR